MAGVVRAVDAVNAYTGLGVCCVNHLTAANVDGYVTNLACRGVGEEDQIACLQLGLGNLLGAGVLSSGVTRDGLAKVCVYILGKAGAVEAARAGSAIYVRAAQEALSIRYDGRTGAVGRGNRTAVVSAAVGRSRGRGVLAADVAVTAAVLNLVPAAGGAYNRSCLAGAKNADYAVRGACAGTNIQRASGVYRLVSRSCRSNVGSGRRRGGGCGVLAADVAVTATVLNLVPAVGGAYNRSAVALLQVANDTVRGACTGTNIQRRCRDVNGLRNVLRTVVGRGRRGIAAGSQILAVYITGLAVYIYLGPLAGITETCGGGAGLHNRQNRVRITCAGTNVYIGGRSYICGQRTSAYDCSCCCGGYCKLHLL